MELKNREELCLLPVEERRKIIIDWLKLPENYNSREEYLRQKNMVEGVVDGKKHAIQNVHTPYCLCEEVIRKAMECSGGCWAGKKILIYNIEFLDILFSYGIIGSNEVWFVNENPLKIKFAKDIYGNSEKFICRDFLQWETNMKFDVVLGNPPYQDNSAKSSKKSWDKFLRKAFEICNKDGFVAFITPFSWATPSNEAFEIFKSHDVKVVNLNGKKYFPKLGTTISWYIIKNSVSVDTTKIICENNEIINIDLREACFLPCIMNKNTINILNKVLNINSIGVKFDSFCHTQRVDRMSKEKSIDYCFPVKHIAKKTIWSNIKHPNTLIKKVIFPISSAMKAEYDAVGEFGCSQHYAWIEVKSQDEADSVMSFLNSNIVSFIRKSTQWTASWSKPILKMIPAIPLNKVWTNKDLYDLFKLDKEEQEYMEETV